jgi:hypothetical protein
VLRVAACLNNEIYLSAVHFYNFHVFTILGPLLDEIRLKMEKKANPSDKQKLFVVSGHDLTLINLLRTLGFTDTPWKPEFSAALLIELHKISQQHVVQVF